MDRYYLEAHRSQRQSYPSFLQDSTDFHNMDTEDYIDALDPDKLMQCPYDKNHKIRACRFPYHLVKCRKNHPDIVQQLATCPFNARHQVPREEIRQHISSCDDKRCIEQDIELEEQSNSVFVWGSTHCGARRFWELKTMAETVPSSGYQVLISQVLISTFLDILECRQRDSD
ncbi:gametocyte-specific factor 1-like isoform X3 [Hemicordylus capensis]|uniref:gametocyte-specific factor 1-like isoform X3 n=1 Tax=Hemicordylus capensis TaxID=884348 RepID=UPI002303B753|nr:gametocyte-specific factor 1-like isoform X3 [Hemicordylus capensis]